MGKQYGQWLWQSWLPFTQEVCRQCDQIKIAKCLLKLSKNDFTRKIKDFDIFTKIA